VLFVTFSFFILFVNQIYWELLNGFAPNSQGRRVWSLAWTSLNVKIRGQRSRSPGTNFLPVENGVMRVHSCGLRVVYVW